MDLKDIKAIIDLMKRNSITEFELEKEGFKIRLRRSGSGGGAHDEISAVGAAPVLVANPLAAAPLLLPTAGGGGAHGSAPPPAGPIEELVKSPMIGTFYRAPSPDSAPYVEVGTEVTPDTVVCIIEAMKVMNEIKAEAKGFITQVLLENGKPVEFGQPLFKLRPS